MEFSQDLAWELLTNKEHELVWDSEDTNQGLGRFFGSLNKKQRHILKICHEVLPIVVKEKNLEQSLYSCSFVHNTFRDYFAAKKIIEELKNFSTDPSNSILNYPILEEKNIRTFVVEQIKKEADLQDELIKLIHLSKNSELWSIAASNAITVLNQAGMTFAGLDFSDIKIPNADLSGGQLDNTKLSNANLTKVKLKGAWLHRAKLNGSNMSGAYFGEMAYKAIEQSVNCYAYSSGHDYFAKVKSNELIIYKVDLKSNTMEAFKTRSIRGNSFIKVIFSFDCKWLALLNQASQIMVLDLIKSTDPIFLTGDFSNNSIAFSQDSKYLAFVSHNQFINIYNIDNQESKNVIKHTGDLYSLNFSLDGKNLFYGDNERGVYILDLENNTNLKIGEHGSGCVLDLHHSLDNNWIGSCGDDKIIYLWNLSDPKKHKSLKGHSNKVNSISFSGDLQILGSGSDDKTIRIWSLSEFTCILVLTGHTDCVYNVLFNTNNSWLTSTSKDQTIRIWDLTDRDNAISNHHAKSTTGHSNYVYSVTFSPDQQWLASGSRDNTIRLWKLRDFKENKILEDNSTLILNELKDFIYSVIFSLDGKWLAAGAKDGIYLYSTKSFMELEGAINVDKSEILRKYFNHPGTRSVGFNQNSELLASGSQDKKVRLFNLMDLTTNNANKVLEGHTKEVYSVAFSYDGKWLVSAGEDHKVFVWDVSDWVNAVVYKIFNYHSGCVDSVTFSLDHNWLGSASWDQSICIYDLKKLDNCQKLKEHAKEVNNITFSQDSQYLFSGDYCGVLMVWHLFKEKNLWTSVLKLRTGFNIFSIGYSSSSNLVATGGSDCSVRVWVHDHEKLTLLNTTHQSILCAEELDLTNTNLSPNNKDLLKQRGAFDEVIIDNFISEDLNSKSLLFSNSLGEVVKVIPEISTKEEKRVNFSHGLKLNV